MAKLAIVFGVVLIALGIAGYVMTGMVFPTSLIPAWFGIALILCGVLASTSNQKRRMLWMHIAVTIGLVGFVFPGFMAIKEWVGKHGAALAHPAAVREQATMSVICLIFVVLSVRSFIAARRGRAQAA